jgi:hypothetical protein
VEVAIMALILIPKYSNNIRTVQTRKAVKPALFKIIENFQDSVFDRGNIETKILNHMWQGCEEEPIAGARTLEGLKQNERLINYLCDRLIDLLYSSSAYHINDDAHNYKEFCKKYANIYENSCPKCRNRSRNFEERI